MSNEQICIRISSKIEKNLQTLPDFIRIKLCLSNANVFGWNPTLYHLAHQKATFKGPYGITYEVTQTYLKHVFLTPFFTYLQF